MGTGWCRTGISFTCTKEGILTVYLSADNGYCVTLACATSSSSAYPSGTVYSANSATKDIGTYFFFRAHKGETMNVYTKWSNDNGESDVTVVEWGN